MRSGRIGSDFINDALRAVTKKTGAARHSRGCRQGPYVVDVDLAGRRHYTAKPIGKRGAQEVGLAAFLSGNRRLVANAVAGRLKNCAQAQNEKEVFHASQMDDVSGPVHRPRPVCAAV